MGYSPWGQKELEMTELLTHTHSYFSLVLTCVFLMINDVEHLFMYLLAICMSSLGKRLFRFSICFLTGFFVIDLYEFFMSFRYCPLSDVYDLQITSAIQ